MAIKIKASTWRNITGAYVKNSTWRPVKQIYVKVVNTWKSVFLSDPPVIVSKPSFRLVSYSGDAATSPQFLDQNLYGKDGSYTNYTGITGRKITYSDTSDGLVRNTIISGDLFTTGAGITTSDRLTVDGKYLFYELTVSNGTDVLDSIEAISNPMLMTKKQPVLGSFTTALTGQSSPNSVLTFNYSLENYYYNRVVGSTSKIRWWRSTNTTASGVLVKEETISDTTTSSDSSGLIGTSTYTVAASNDNNSYIVVEIIGVNSWTTNNGYGGLFSDYQIASYNSGVITGQYQFAFGNTLYVGSNGYIGLDNGGTTKSAPGSGRNVNVYNNDLVQYRLQEYSDSSNYHLYFRSYRYQSPLVQSAINALDYQIKFYTGQAYCDVKLIRKGSSVPFELNSPGYYGSGLSNFAGLPGPYVWAANSVLRVYFNGTAATLSGITWTDIEDEVWKDITTAQIDDNFTSVVTSANQQAPVPTTPTALSAAYSSNQIVLTFSGGTGDQYDIYYGNSSTRPTDKQAFSDFPNVTSPYTATTLTARDLTRYFWVRKSSGDLRSNWFPAAGGVETRIPLLAPPVPNTPTTSGVSKTNITVSWTAGTAVTDVTDAGTSFEVYTSDTNSTPATTTSGTTKTSPASYTYTASTSPSTQYFWVRAVNKDANSAWSAVASATPTASKPPTVPTSITAGTKTNTSIAWSWTAPTATTTNLAATGYDYVIDSSTSDPTGAGTAITATSVTTSSLTKNTDYYLHVRSSNADGKSAWATSAVTKTNNDSFFTVSFNVNGSGGTTPDPVTQSTAGGTVTLAAAISRTGYSFGGWNTATDGTGTNRAAGTSFTPTADITLYAKWTVSYAAVVWGSMPSPAFLRSGGNGGSTSTSYRWGWNNQTPTSGDYDSSGITWEWQRSTANTTTDQRDNPTGFISGGTRPRRTGGGLTVGGSTYDNRVSSLSTDYNTTGNAPGANEPVGFSTSPRYLRYRAVVTGSDGTVYRSNYSAWV